MNQQQRREYLMSALLQENTQDRGLELPAGEEEQRQLLRGLMNIRLPKAIPAKVLKVQDAYLQERSKQKGTVDSAELPVKQQIGEGSLCLWQGDITTLRCDAMVNAANSGMTGCYIPNHCCIDNCIHTYAGMQLRWTCEQIMQRQGHAEPAGSAKITSAFNLPCRYVLHTVGPIISGTVTKNDRVLLESCYQSCLELAEEHGLESVAFCCISTGEFHFPNELAAEIAVQTVRKFMQKATSVKRVIFNVFKDEDRAIYEKLLQAEGTDTESTGTGGGRDYRRGSWPFRFRRI